MHRILFDTNAGTATEGFILWLSDSVRDIEAIGSEVHDGLRVILYMPDEIELEAIMKFDNELGCWRGIPVQQK